MEMTWPGLLLGNIPITRNEIGSQRWDLAMKQSMDKQFSYTALQVPCGWNSITGFQYLSDLSQLQGLLLRTQSESTQRNAEGFGGSGHHGVGQRSSQLATAQITMIFIPELLQVSDLSHDSKSSRVPQCRIQTGARRGCVREDIP